MAEIKTEDEELLTVKVAAAMTGRSAQMIRRYIRQGVVQAVQDPQDGRARLIPWDQLAVIAMQKRRGFIRRTVTMTWPDGTVRTKITRVLKA